MTTVRLRRHSPEDIGEFLAVIDREPEITERLLVTRSLNHILRAQVRDVEALTHFTLVKLGTSSCVAETAAMIVPNTSESVAMSR